MKLTPQVNTPQVNTPQVNTPQVNTPQVNTPQVNTPQVNTPQVNTPQNFSRTSNNYSEFKWALTPAAVARHEAMKKRITKDYSDQEPLRDYSRYPRPIISEKSEQGPQEDTAKIEPRIQIAEQNTPNNPREVIVRDEIVGRDPLGIPSQRQDVRRNNSMGCMLYGDADGYRPDFVRMKNDLITRRENYFDNLNVDRSTKCDVKNLFKSVCNKLNDDFNKTNRIRRNREEVYSNHFGLGNPENQAQHVNKLFEIISNIRAEDDRFKKNKAIPDNRELTRALGDILLIPQFLTALEQNDYRVMEKFEEMHACIQFFTLQ